MSIDRTFRVDVAHLHLASPLPAGKAVLWLAPTAPEPLGGGELKQAIGQRVEISTRDPKTNIEGRQKWVRTVGKCRKQTLWRFSIPRALADIGPLDLEVPSSPKEVKVVLRTRTGATVRTEESRTVVEVAGVSKSGERGVSSDRPLEFEIELRANTCS